ncbi:MAG: hypothetical protein AAGA60_18925 [Cyanobacteria bacterium P01_E01_bin.42]
MVQAKGAIAGAKESYFLHDEGLANELAAKFYLAWGKSKFAALYLQEAYFNYSHWGAKGKIEALERDYPQLLAPTLTQLSLKSNNRLEPRHDRQHGFEFRSNARFYLLHESLSHPL